MNREDWKNQLASLFLTDTDGTEMEPYGPLAHHSDGTQSFFVRNARTGRVREINYKMVEHGIKTPC